MNCPKIIEVGPRDGLQNIALSIPLELKLKLVEDLLAAGLQEIEAAAFVSPQWVPQMAESNLLLERLESKSTHLWALVPNAKGFDAFQKSKLNKIAFFTAVSDSFNRKNTNKTFAESLDVLKPLCVEAKALGHTVRLYLSTVFFCPFEGQIPLKQVLERMQPLLDWPVDDFSFGDTIGKASPGMVREFCKSIQTFLPPSKISLHFHDTYGMALANCAEGLNQGLYSFDSSIAGLGGCPYAPGASGNLATEDLVYFLHQQGLPTVVDLHKLVHCADQIESFLGLNLPSKARQALKKSHG